MAQILKNWTIKKKLITLLGVALGALLFLSVSAFLSLRTQMAAASDLAAYEQIARNFLGSNSIAFKLVSMVSTNANKADIDKAKDELIKKAERASAILDSLSKDKTLGEQEQKIMAAAKSFKNDLLTNLEVYFADAIMGAVMVLGLEDSFRKFETEVSVYLAKMDESQKQRANSTIALIILISLAATGAVLFIASVTVRNVIRSSELCIHFAKQIRDGYLKERMTSLGEDEFGVLARHLNEMADTLKVRADLLTAISNGKLDSDIELRSNDDQFGLALQHMSQNLNSMIASTKEAADQVAAGAAQVNQASQALSNGATRQASSLEEVSSSITEIAGQIKTNAENAAQANQLAKSSRESAEGGQIQINATAAAMQDIRNSSQQIARIIKVIDDIAFQTNLLALNAAVEAARAGKHGKGFAVVAEEVRNLASRSAKAARETTEMIEAAGKNVENGLEMTTQTVNTFQTILTGAIKVADLVGEIAAASNQQSQGVTQITTGLGEIDSVTQQNASNAEETAAAAQTLSKQGTELQGLLAQFQVKQGQTGTSLTAEQ